MIRTSLKNYTFITVFSMVSFVVILLSITFNASAQQYNITGSSVAMAAPGCYRLTNTTGQGGALWNLYKINLTQAFDITLSLNFGNRSEIHYIPATCGADGIAFILQPLSSGIVGTGSGAGFHGITPSVGVVMDTYVDNPTDPGYQHISINKNGDELHGTTNELSPPTAAVGFPVNITDGLDHLFRFSWTPTSASNGIMNIYFGNATILPTTPTITYTGNLISNIFLGDPNVYWGVTGTTGGCWNVQYVCMTTISNFLSDTTTCAESPVNFTNNSVSGLPITSWTWHFGDGDSSNLQSPAHTYNLPGTYNVSLAIINSGGFSSTMTHSIVVHPKPNVVVNSPTICNGDTAVLTASGATTYSWNNGLTNGAVKNVTPSTTTSYIVTGVNTWGCVNKDTSLVTVNPLPLISLTPNSYICIGDTIDLTVGGANTYLWSTNQTLATISVSPVIDTIYTVRATDLNACFVDTSVTVSMFESPQISFSFAPTPAEGCAPITITFTDESTPAIQSWLWDFGDGFTSTIQIPSHEFVTPGDFDISLTITTTDGCVGSLTLPAYVKVFENPIAAFTTNEHQFSLSYANLICNSTSSSANVNNWHWDFGNTSLTNDTSNIQNPTFQYLNQGTFLVWLYVTTIHGCSDSTSQAIRVIEDSLIFPNIITPNGDGINDFLDIKNLENLESNKLMVFNRWGKKVYEKDHYIPDVDRWDGNDLADGTYYYILTYKGILQQGEYKSSLTILRK